MILDRYNGHKVYVLAPLVHNRKGHYKELFEQLTKKGFLHVRVDGELREITYGMKLDRYKNHSIELVVDKLKVSAQRRQPPARLGGRGPASGRQADDAVSTSTPSRRLTSARQLMDPTTGSELPRAVRRITSRSTRRLEHARTARASARST